MYRTLEEGEQTVRKLAGKLVHYGLDNGVGCSLSPGGTKYKGHADVGRDLADRRWHPSLKRERSTSSGSRDSDGEFLLTPTVPLQKRPPAEKYI